MKECITCGEIKPLKEFCKRNDVKDGRQGICRKCNNTRCKLYRDKHKNELRIKAGHQSMHENKSCSAYLGIVIAERLCKYLFNDVEIMPYGNPKFDFICNKGKLIDVKSACISLNNIYPHWQFKIDKNKVPDHFILVAFDNRTDLNLLRIWMIPGKELDKQSNVKIYLSKIEKWNLWEQDINNAKLCCDKMKAIE